MKRKNTLYLTLLALCFGSNVVFGQLSKGVKYLEKKQYEKAQQALILDIEKEEEKACAAYYLAKVFMQKEYEEGYNLSRAYEYSDKAVDYAQHASAGAKKKMTSYKLGLMSIRKLRDDIVKATLKEAETSKNIALFDEVLANFKNLNVTQIERTHKQRNKLALEEAKQINTASAWQNFWKKYNESLKKYDEAIYKEAEKLLFAAYIKEKSWNSFAEFANQYPENIYVSDSAASIKMQLTVRKNTLEAYKAMLDAYPKTPLADIAKDSLYSKVLGAGDVIEYDFFVRKYTDYPEIIHLWNAFYKEYCKEDKNCATSFYEKYSAAPKNLKNN